MVRVPFDPAADYYGLLGVAAGAPPEQIQAAYRRLAKAYHPDLNAGSSAAAARMARLNVAKSVLLDPTSRALYDQLRVIDRQPGPPRSAAAQASARVAATTVVQAQTAPIGRVRHRVTPRGRDGSSRRRLDRGTGFVLLIGMPLVAALVLYLFDAVHLSFQPLPSPPTDLVLAQMPSSQQATSHSVADAAFMMVHAQPPSRDLALRVNNFVLARADSSPESANLQADARRLVRSASAGDTEAWNAVVSDLCYLAGRC